MSLLTILAYKALFDWINNADIKENENHDEMVNKHNELKEEMARKENEFLESCKSKVSEEDIKRLIERFHI